MDSQLDFVFQELVNQDCGEILKVSDNQEVLFRIRNNGYYYNVLLRDKPNGFLNFVICNLECGKSVDLVSKHVKRDAFEKEFHNELLEYIPFPQAKKNISEL